MSEFTLDQYFHQIQELNCKKAIDDALQLMVEMNELMGLYELNPKSNPLIKTPPIEDNIVLGYNQWIDMDNNDLVDQAPYHPGYGGAVFGLKGRPLSEVIRERLKHNKVRFFASDNISDYISEEERDHLVDELESKFASVLDSLVIDRENDPNSHDTARRLEDVRL